MTTTINKGCTCEKCIDACKKIPGAFAPGEARRLAKHMGLTLAELFCKYLNIDYYIGNPNYEEHDEYREVDMLIPATDTYGPGERATFGFRFADNRCVFLNEQDRCDIHEFKPMECREALCCADTKEGRSFQDLAKLWDTKEGKDEIAEAKDVNNCRD